MTNAARCSNVGFGGTTRILSAFSLVTELPEEESALSMSVSKQSTALVTGASKGIGAAIAIAFANAGYNVVVNYSSDAAGAAQTVSRCKAKGVEAIAIQANVANPAEVAAMFCKCREVFGSVTCLINNAGIIGSTTSLADLKAGTLHDTFATNLFGTVYCMQEAIGQMRTDEGGQGGTVINISSLAATLGSPGEYIHYAASKGAVETLTIGSGKELGPLGIRVAAIRVGTTETDLHTREGNADRPAAVAAATPLGRVAQPDDIADAAVWLSSKEARFVSGTILTVAGGFAP